MGGAAIIVDKTQCDAIGRLLGGLATAPTLVHQSLSTHNPAVVGNFNLLLVAICHQTQHLQGLIAGRCKRGWDYLEARLRAASEQEGELLSVARWTRITAAELHTVLTGPDSTIELAGLDCRSELINDLGCNMQRAGVTTLKEVCDRASWQCRGESSLFSFLGGCRAYADPLEKKSRLLVGLLRDVHGWQFKDADQVGAPVDYHEIRGHLRLGTVVVIDARMRRQMLSRAPVEEAVDLAVRRAISDCIDRIAASSGRFDPLQIHYILWAFFRAMCRRSDPACLGKASSHFLDYGANSDASVLAPLFAAAGDETGCVFAPYCTAYRKKEFPVEYNYAGSNY